MLETRGVVMMKGQVYSFDAKSGVGYLRPMSPGSDERLSPSLYDRAKKRELLMFSVADTRSGARLNAGSTVSYETDADDKGIWKIAKGVTRFVVTELHPLATESDAPEGPIPEWELRQWKS